MQNWAQEDSHLLTGEQIVTGVHMYVWCLCPQDVDEFFQTEREHNHLLTGCSKSAAEVNLEAVCLICQRSVSEYQTHNLVAFPCRDSWMWCILSKVRTPSPTLKLDLYRAGFIDVPLWCMYVA